MSYGYPDGILLFDKFLTKDTNRAYIEGNCYYYNTDESSKVNLGGSDTFICEEVEVYKVIKI